MTEFGRPAAPLEGKAWNRFYEARGVQPVRPLLTRTLDLREGGGLGPGQAIDLGCGEGTDTAELLSRGWRVVAIDASEEGITRTRSRAEALGLADGLDARQARFEDLDGLPPADLVYSAVGLPFCAPEHFGDLWRHIRAAADAEDGGWVAVQLFGPNDTWADNPRLNFHSRDEVEKLFAGLEIRSFEERDEDGHAISGPKHWHIFDVIASAGV